MKSLTKGFTIIELLVVIIVISLLASMATFEYINQLQMGRDTNRISDLKSIAIALEMYRNDPANKEGNVSHYPYTGTVNGAINSTVDATNLKSTGVNDANIQGYFSNIRNDPQAGRNLQQYYYYSVSNKGIDYKLSVQLEQNTQAMINDGGTNPDRYEVFSEGGQNLPTT